MLQSYYRCPDVIDNNFAAEDRFLQLNCAGEQVYSISLDVSSVRRDNYLMYVAGGKIDVISPAGVGELEAGDFAILGKNEPFHYIFDESAPIDYFWVHFGGYGAIDLLESCGIKIDTPYRIRGMHETVTRGFGEVFDVFKFRTARFDSMANAAVVSLISLLSGCVMSAERGGQNERLKDRLSCSLNYIHAHYTENIDVGSLAAMDYLSPGRYRALFREMMNVSPLEYITMLRMNMARELLTGTKLDIAAVAEAAGYGDARYFSRVFRKIIGCSPREYKKIGNR